MSGRKKPRHQRIQNKYNLQSVKVVTFIFIILVMVSGVSAEFDLRTWLQNNFPSSFGYATSSLCQTDCSTYIRNNPCSSCSCEYNNDLKTYNIHKVAKSCTTPTTPSTPTTQTPTNPTSTTPTNTGKWVTCYSCSQGEVKTIELYNSCGGYMSSKPLSCPQIDYSGGKEYLYGEICLKDSDCLKAGDLCENFVCKSTISTSTNTMVDFTKSDPDVVYVNNDDQTLKTILAYLKSLEKPSLTQTQDKQSYQYACLINRPWSTFDSPNGYSYTVYWDKTTTELDDQKCDKLQASQKENFVCKVSKTLENGQKATEYKQDMGFFECQKEKLSTFFKNFLNNSLWYILIISLILGLILLVFLHNPKYKIVGIILIVLGLILLIYQISTIDIWEIIKPW